MGDIGPVRREITFEPLPDAAPEPAEQPAPQPAEPAQAPS
jgi:hypothetical protein